MECDDNTNAITRQCAGAIKPLIFPVVVEAKTVRCGIPDAFDRLRATAFLQSDNRQVKNGRQELALFLNRKYDHEVDALKSVMLSIYLAIPVGAMKTQDMTSSSSSLAVSPYDDDLSYICEPSGWNDALDQAWRHAVLCASSPTGLMECLLLLEFYLDCKGWLVPPHAKLLSALPNAHFSLCGTTYPAVALRLFCLDKALAYDKVVIAPRERRIAGYFSEYALDSEPNAKNTRGQQSFRSNRKSADAAMRSSEVSGRLKRSAARNASSRIKQSAGHFDSDDDDDDDGDHDEDGDDDDEDDDKDWDDRIVTLYIYM